MNKGKLARRPAESQVRARRGYFECRYGQLHVHHAMPPGGGFEEATALLCLHDCPGAGRIFTGLLTLMGMDRSAYAPDLPGYGESDPPSPASPTIADYAAAIGDFLDNMRLRRLDLFADRTGVLIATELAVTRAEQIGRLVMMSVPLITEGERAAAAAPPVANPAQDAYRAPGWQRWALEAAARYPLRERLAKLTQRLLVLRPRDDLWDATLRVRELLPAARVLELEQPGTQLLTGAPQRIADAVREFLRG
jgi:pimeloyl-ACP methyl ester carboxylesterase